MNRKEIRAKAKKLRNQIALAENELIKLQGECKHPKTFTGNWQLRPGSVHPAIICSDCGNLVKIITDTTGLKPPQ